MQSLWDFLYSGVYDFVTDAFVLLTKMAIKGWFEMQLFVAEIGYKAFREVVGGIGIGSTITSYYSSWTATCARCWRSSACRTR